MQRKTKITIGEFLDKLNHTIIKQELESIVCTIQLAKDGVFYVEVEKLSSYSMISRFGYYVARIRYVDKIVYGKSQYTNVLLVGLTKGFDVRYISACNEFGELASLNYLDSKEENKDKDIISLIQKYYQLIKNV